MGRERLPFPLHLQISLFLPLFLLLLLKQVFTISLRLVRLTIILPQPRKFKDYKDYILENLLQAVLQHRGKVQVLNYRDWALFLTPGQCPVGHMVLGLSEDIPRIVW